MSNQPFNEIHGSRPDGGLMAGGEAATASLLEQMRDRLASLSDEARSIRSQVPYEFGPDVERIQQQMLRLGERLSDLGRGALVPYNAVEQRANEQRVKAVRYVTEEDVRVGRVQPDQIIALGGPAGVRRAQEEHVADLWDAAAAGALAELYESGEAYAPSARRESAPAFPPLGPPLGGMQAAAAGNRSMQKPVYACGSVTTMAEGTRGTQRGCAMDSSVLDQRFAEIAARIEQSLSQIKPEAALASLGRRFDQLESQINTMIGQMATRADVEELRIAESQIEEIASQLSQFRRQMARLDLIDAHLGTLTSQLSDERLTRLINEGMQPGADAGRLDAIDAQLRLIAVQLSDERLSGLVSRSAAREVDYQEVAQVAAQSVAANFHDAQQRETHSRDIGEVRGMLENLINERRHNDENNASMLETMQQAIIRVLDRIDAIELAQQQQAAIPAAPAVPEYTREAPAVPRYAQAAPAPAAASVTYDDLVPPTATVYAEMPRAEAEQSDFLPVEAEPEAEADQLAYRRDAADDRPPSIPVYTTASFDLEAAFSRSRDAEAASFGEAPAAKPSVEVLRHDFIADAHRAKLKAASKPDQAAAASDLRAGELSVGTREAPAKPRRRSIFSFRSQHVAMSLLVLLAAVPAAIFFMPRTNAARLEATPAAMSAPAPKHSGALPAAEPMEAAPMPPSSPDAAPPANKPASKQTRQEVPEPEQQGTYEDAGAASAPVDTASLPDGITMQQTKATGPQLAQMNDQARMAYMSGQLGIAAAKATPASLMEDQLVHQNGAATADDATGGPSKLPPATVGPYSLRLAAAQGDASAQFEVASRLAEGKGTDQDLADAARWYQRAAASGFAMAQFRLGTLYERGLGVKADPQRAQVWYERAATQGNVKAMHNLAVLIASHASKGDYQSAVRWFSAAAEHGLSDSQYNLAVLYENGLGVPKDLQQAYKWLILAAKSGDKDAAARRDALHAKLSEEELAAVEAEAKSWSAKPITGMSNDARLAGQAWRDGSRRG